MEILTVFKKILGDNVAVTAKRRGGIYLNEAEQDSERPNVVLLLVSGGEGYTHMGPDNLHDDLVRVYCRGETAQQAGELGTAVEMALKRWTGVLFGHEVQLIQHLNRNSDYDSGAKIYRQITDFRAFYNRTSN